MNQISYRHIVVLLDASGSMLPVANATIAACNKFFEEQAQADGHATFTLALFNTARKVLFYHEPLPRDGRRLLTESIYRPTGSTALLDAIGETIAEASILPASAAAARPSRVSFVMITDGCENASRKYTREAVFELIGQKQEKEGWQFLFLGANQDAIQSGAALGVAPGGSLSVSHIASGITSAFHSAEALVQSYSALVNPKTRPSFNDEDVRVQERSASKNPRHRPSQNRGEP